MADAEVELSEDGVVTVDVGDLGLPATPEPEPVVEVTEPVAPKQPRQTKQAAVDEATAALSQAVKTAEDARKTAEDARRAAEATALSERQGREAAQRLAEQRAHEAKTYREQAENHELTIITSGIETASRELETYQDEYARLMEAGEFVKASSINTKVAKAAAALDRLEDAKLSYESGARKTAPQAAEPQPAAQSAFEQYVSGFAPQAQAWLRAHPDCVPSNVGGDPTKNAKMMAGHYDAMARNIAPNSEEYFRTIEEHTGHRQPVVPATPVSAAAEVTPAGTEPVVPAKPKPAPAPRQAQPSAPVSRDAPAANGAPVMQSVRLTPQQQEIALVSASPRQIPQANGTTIQESDAEFRKRAFGQYARELVAATAEGKIGRMSH